MKAMTLQQADNAIETATSRMGGGEFTPEELAEALSRGHRTLQQNVMAFCLQFIDWMADNHENGRVDMRNEAAAEVAHRIKATIFEDGKYPNPMPFV